MHISGLPCVKTNEDEVTYLCTWFSCWPSGTSSTPWPLSNTHTHTFSTALFINRIPYPPTSLAFSLFYLTPSICVPGITTKARLAMHSLHKSRDSLSVSPCVVYCYYISL